MHANRRLRLGRGCTVTRVLFDDTRNRLGKNAEGVECIDYKGDTYQFYASKEVILSAGTFGSPKILFNSGIGPLSILRAFGKPERVINERIGQKIMNQQGYGMTYQDLTIPNPNFYELASIATQKICSKRDRKLWVCTRNLFVT